MNKNSHIRNKINIMFAYVVMCLLVISMGLHRNTQTQTTNLIHNHGFLTQAIILKDQIFFMNQFKTNFGYFSKQTGQVSLSIDISQNQKVLDVTEYVVQFLDNEKLLKIFNISKKKLQVDKSYLTQNFQRIISKLNYIDQSVILTEKDLRVYKRQARQKISQYTLIYQAISQKTGSKNTKQQFIEMAPIFNKNYQFGGLIIISIISRDDTKQLCLKKSNLEKMIREQCIQMPAYQKINPDVYDDSQNIFVIFDEQTIIFSKQLELKTKIPEKVKKVVQSYILFENGSTFITNKDAIYQQLFVESRPKLIYVALTISSSKNQIVLKTNRHQQFAIIPPYLNNMKPEQAWVYWPGLQDLNSIDEKQIKQLQKRSCDLVIQYQNKDIRYLHAKKGQVKQKWIVKAIQE